MCGSARTSWGPQQLADPSLPWDHRAAGPAPGAGVTSQPGRGDGHGHYRWSAAFYKQWASVGRDWDGGGTAAAGRRTAAAGRHSQPCVRRQCTGRSPAEPGWSLVCRCPPAASTSSPVCARLRHAWPASRRSGRGRGGDDGRRHPRGYRACDE